MTYYSKAKPKVLCWGQECDTLLLHTRKSTAALSNVNFYILLSIVLPILWKWDWLVLLDTWAIVVCCLAGCANQRPGVDAVGFQKGTRTLYDYNGRFITGQLVDMKCVATNNSLVFLGSMTSCSNTTPELRPPSMMMLLLLLHPWSLRPNSNFYRIGRYVIKVTTIMIPDYIAISFWQWQCIVCRGNNRVFLKKEHPNASHSWQTNYLSIPFRLLLAGGSLSPQCDPTHGWRIHNGSVRDFQC